MAKKILVVDDEPDILKVVTFRLRKAGYEIITAEDGQKALNLIKTQRPDLVLLDLRLPVIDGSEVCKQVKADDEVKNIPIILLTATSHINKIADKAKELKADDYLIKPFDPEELLKRVKKFIG